MKKINTVALICFFLFNLSQAYCQSDTELIKKSRIASNKALESKNYEDFLAFLTHDVVITEGDGEFLIGQQALRNLFSNMERDKSEVYWVRTTSEVELNEKTGLAWETGTWKQYNKSNDSSSTIGGNYSAMWIKQGHKWLIKSELFVTLD